MIKHKLILSLYNPNVVLSGTEQRREKQKLRFKKVEHFPVLSLGSSVGHFSRMMNRPFQFICL